MNAADATTRFSKGQRVKIREREEWFEGTVQSVTNLTVTVLWDSNPTPVLHEADTWVDIVKIK
jgi:hypothetical protein